MALAAHLKLNYKVPSKAVLLFTEGKMLVCKAHWRTFASVLIGAMYPTSMRINEEGRLVVNFKTEARFRGQFVMSHPGTVHAP